MTAKQSSVSKIIALTVVAIVLAQPAHSASLQQNNSPRNAIVGSWIETITPEGPGAPPPFKSLGVYNEDGTSVFSDQGMVRSTTGLVLTSAIGSWSYLKDRTFSFTHIELISDLDGNLTNVVKIRGEATLDSSGDRYTARVHLDVCDP